MRASATTCAPASRQRERGRVADAARGAGDERDAVGEGSGGGAIAWKGAPSRAGLRNLPNRLLRAILRARVDQYAARRMVDRSRQLASASSDNCRGRRFLRRLVGQRGRIVAGEAVVGELRPQRIALLVAHGAVDALDRQERERIGADEVAHAFEVMGRRQQLVALRRIDAVIVGMGDRRGGDAEMHLAWRRPRASSARSSPRSCRARWNRRSARCACR